MLWQDARPARAPSASHTSSSTSKPPLDAYTPSFYASLPSSLTPVDGAANKCRPWQHEDCASEKSESPNCQQKCAFGEASGCVFVCESVCMHTHTNTLTHTLFYACIQQTHACVFLLLHPPASLSVCIIRERETGNIFHLHIYARTHAHTHTHHTHTKHTTHTHTTHTHTYV